MSWKAISGVTSIALTQHFLASSVRPSAFKARPFARASVLLLCHGNPYISPFAMNYFCTVSLLFSFVLSTHLRRQQSSIKNNQRCDPVILQHPDPVHSIVDISTNAIEPTSVYSLMSRYRTSLLHQETLSSTYLTVVCPIANSSAHP